MFKGYTLPLANCIPMYLFLILYCVEKEQTSLGTLEPAVQNSEKPLKIVFLLFFTCCAALVCVFAQIRSS